MRIEIEKRPNGAGVLRCFRADGTVAWQKQSQHAGFFAQHDLTHFAVETSLGFRSGFFGLVAQGWEIDDTTGKGAKGPLPQDACEAESIVGMLDAERSGGTSWTAEEFNRARPAGSRPLSEEELARIRSTRQELFDRWREVPAGGKIQLTFEL
jgi:hypothetical protein